jgi:hypothetical protein
MSPALAIGLLLLLASGGKKSEPSPRPRPDDPHPYVPPAPPPRYDPIDPAPPVPAPGPAPLPDPPAPPAPPQDPARPAQTAMQKAAVKMLAALQAGLSNPDGRGAYRTEDQNVYKAFQQAARLRKDGFPGKGTIERAGTSPGLRGVLAALGLALPDGLVVFPWLPAGSPGGGFHRPNAPDMWEWDGSYARPGGNQPPAPPPPPAYIPPPPVPSPDPNAPHPWTGNVPSLDPMLDALTQAMAAKMNAGALSTTHGAYRKADQPTYRAFQKAAKLVDRAGHPMMDGLPGPSTMKALRDSVARMGLPPLRQFPTYPFHTLAYDGKDSPLLADWNAPSVDVDDNNGWRPSPNGGGNV